MSDNFDFVREILGSCKRKERNYKTFIVKDSKTNLYRVAKAEDVEKRFKLLHSANPDITIVATINKNVKSQILKELGATSTGEDWLSISDNDIKNIINKYSK